MMLTFVDVLCLCASFITVHSLATIGSRQRRQIAFPGDDANSVPTFDGESDLQRQGIPPFPPLPGNNFNVLPGNSINMPTGNAINLSQGQQQSVNPFIVTPTSTTQTTCVCVPIGSCNTTSNTDGSGLLDFRIVTNTSTQLITNTVTQTACGSSLVLCCSPGPYQCGIRYPPVANSPVPGDGQAPYGAYPWQAVLLGPGDVYVASGVLISSQSVLTVAHRVTQFVNSPNTLKVRLGEWNAAGTNEPIQAQDYVVASIATNPNFNGQNLKNDMAVLRLVNAVTLGTTPTITTACLPSISFTGSRCWVSGWGRNAFTNGSFQPILKQVDVPILQQSSCDMELKATRLGSNFQFDTQSFICAGGESGKDACTGDGGSPLVCSLGNRWFVAGLVSWGIGCGVSNVPGVYVNIQSYVPWIQTVAV